jgi:hypothetical protein
LREAARAELGDDPAVAEVLQLSPEDAEALLALARDVAHGSGARQYAPLATFLAGRLAQRRGGAAEVGRVVAALTRAAQTAGPAGDDASGRS